MRLFHLILLAMGLTLAAPTIVWAQPDPAADDDDDGDVEDDDEAPPAEPADDAETSADATQDSEAKPAKKKSKKKKAKKKSKKKKAKKKSKKKKAKKKSKKKKTAKKKTADKAADEAATEESANKPPADPPATDGPTAPAKMLSEKPIGDRVPLQQRSAGIDGVIGLDRVWSADPGAQGTLRMRLGLRYFEATDFPTNGADSTFLGTTFALAYTPIDNLETFINVTSTSNENPGTRPTLLQTQGDISLGLKGGWFITDNIALGLAGALNLVSGLGSSGFDFDGLGYEVRALSTFDFARDNTAPVRVLLDVSFVGENSEIVFANQAQEPDPIQEWGLQAYRYDRLHIGLGLEFPANEYLSPFLEYRIGTPFLVELTRRGRDSDDFTFAAVPHTIAAGVRVFPIEELAGDLIFRQGLSDDVFTGVAATPPWEMVFGLTYTLDPRPQIIEREVASAATPKQVAKAPVLSGLKGRVIDAKTKKPIPGAIITYRGTDLSPQQADGDGRFEGYRFKPGKVRVRAVAEGYKRSKTKKITVKAGKDAKVTLKLKRDPKSLNGELIVKAVGPKGKPMGASIVLSDADTTRGESLPEAPFKATLKAGRYMITADTKGFKTIKRPIELKGGKPTVVSIPMQRGKGVIMLGLDGLPATAPAPPKGGRAAPVRTPRYTPAPATGGGGGGGGRAYVKGKAIRVRGKIEFQGDSATLTGKSKSLLNAVAAVMKRNTKLKKVRIGAHTDGRGDAAAKRTLSIKRAQSVKSYLVSRGVARGRLSTKGFGPDKPIAPNMSARGRAQNNRVDLAILEMGQ